MTTRGPQNRVRVQVQTRDGAVVASATCFFSSWTDESSGQPRWRGFLTFIDPPGALQPGSYQLVLPTGAQASVTVREHRSEGTREQAVFMGEGPPPQVPSAGDD